MATPHNQAKKGEIAKGTSPVKLFEYMALGKPIVTTAMKECKKYKSVMVAENKNEFLNKIEEAIKYEKENNQKYFKLLEEEALDNTWETKAKLIIDLIKKYE